MLNDPDALGPTVARNLADLVRHALGHAPPTPAVVVHDADSPLARLLVGGYRAALPHAAFVAFEPVAVEAAIDALPAGALVVLVQSTRFDMGAPSPLAGRFRLELFRRGHHVIEHPHLARMRVDEVPTYVDALAYEPAYYRTVGAALKARIDGASAIAVTTPVGVLRYAGPFEDAKLNVGDYTGFANVGGQFPIGEVFTEPVDLEGVDGVLGIAAFGAGDFSVTFLDEPFSVWIERGRIVRADGPPAFDAILAEIAAAEGQVWVRELGFGLNRALTRARRVNDVGTYERMCGVHLSLGAKHAVYPKPGFNKRHTRFHVDVFAWTDRVEIDGDVVYAGDRYVV